MDPNFHDGVTFTILLTITYAVLACYNEMESLLNRYKNFSRT